MGDIKSKPLIYAKGFLFILTGCMAAGLLLWEHPGIKVLLLLVVTVWCFSRFYYFMFYVIEHYVDPGYRFSGIGSFVGYLFRLQRDHRRPSPSGR